MDPVLNRKLVIDGESFDVNYWWWRMHEGALSFAAHIDTDTSIINRLFGCSTIELINDDILLYRADNIQNVRVVFTDAVRRFTPTGPDPAFDVYIQGDITNGHE